ncbi:MAG: hypothetical protein IKO55_17100 [Kiritimatiellae bacterium]|nr:hypothetical protein [Kiritimatiellia bacterium]
MFQNCGSTGITLADLAISGPAVTAKTAWRNCNISFFQSGVTAKIDQDRRYWMDWDGNWRKYVQGGNINSDPVMTAEQMAAVVINPGEGLICNFANAAGKITYAGEVLSGAGETKQMTILRPQQNFVVTNPSGATINLGQITISGPAVSAKTAWRNCNISFFQSGVTAKIDQDRRYWMDWNGNWRKYVQGGNINSDPVMTAEQIAAVTIAAGEGIICNFANAAAQITLPTAL